MRGVCRSLGGGQQQVDRVGELAAIAQQRHEPVDGFSEIRIVLARGLEQGLRAIPILELRELARFDEHARAHFRIRDRAARALEHRQRFFLGHAALDRQPRERFERVGPIRLEPIGFAQRLERGGVVLQLALVEQRDLAEQLGALVVVGQMHRAPAQQIDEHRPLRGRAIEQLETFARLFVRRIDDEHALEAIRRIVAAPDVLPRRRELGEAAAGVVVVDVDQRVHRVERQLAPAIGELREPQQRIDVGDDGRLSERRQPHDERAIGVLAVLEVFRELAQDLRTFARFLGRLGAREVHVDDLQAFGVERRVRDACGRALDRRAQAIALELWELFQERADEDLDRADPRGMTPHDARVTETWVM